MWNKTGRFEKIILALSNWLNWIAGGGMVAMLLLIVADIIAAKLFKWPVPGGIEIVSFLGVIIVAFSIAQTQVLRGHIEVEFFVNRLPKSAQKVVYGVIYPCGMILFALLGWRSYEFGHSLQLSGEVSMTQGIPFYPFVYAIVFCCVAVVLVLLLQLLKAMKRT